MPDSSNRCFELPLSIGQGDCGDRETSRYMTFFNQNTSLEKYCRIAIHNGQI